MFDKSGTERYPLIKALEQQLEQVSFRFHVPAHLADRGPHPASDFDLTELSGLDNLFEPAGVIAESQRLAAEFFGADETYYLVNGSSAGLIAAIWSSCRRGEKVILGRNIHRSAIAGLISVSYTHLDVYKRQNVRYQRGQGAQFAYIMATLIGAVNSSAEENHYQFKKGIVFNEKDMTDMNRDSVSYTHLDVYKRQVN